MVFPVSSYVNEINVVTLAKFLPSVFATTVRSSFRQTSFGQDLLCFFNVLREKVAKCYDLCSRNVSEALYGARTTHTKADEANANNVKFGSY